MVDFKKLQIEHQPDQPTPGQPGQPDHKPPRRYVRYDRLLSSGKAVWKQSHYVWYSTAGDHPLVRRLICQTGKAAKQTAMLFWGELRKARSDDEYNSILARLLGEVANAWHSDPKIQHVHSCDHPDCKPNPDGSGATSCGFDWSDHELSASADCRCGASVDPSSDLAGSMLFVVHRDIKKGLTVYV